jgi:hypothetical protein
LSSSLENIGFQFGILMYIRQQDLLSRDDALSIMSAICAGEPGHAAEAERADSTLVAHQQQERVPVPSWMFLMAPQVKPTGLVDVQVGHKPPLPTMPA